LEDTGRDALNAAFADLTAATRAAAAALGRGAAPPLNRDAFLYDERFNETENLAAWRASFVEADTLPPLLGALLLARAWRITEPVQRQAWLAPLLAGLYLRRRGRTKAHLLSFTLGLRLLRPKPRRGATLAEDLRQDLAVIEAAGRETLAQHDRLMLAKELLARKGRGRRDTSALPRLAALLLDSPLVSVPMIAENLKISPQAAQILVRDLGPHLREITGRKRYRAWSIGSVRSDNFAGREYCRSPRRLRPCESHRQPSPIMRKWIMNMSARSFPPSSKK
jgi:hypothetical protein